MANKRSVGNNMIWNSIGATIYSGCQWLLTVLVVRLNGNYADAGILSLAMSVANPLYNLATLNLRTFQVSNMLDQFSDCDFLVNRLFSSGISILLVSCWLAVKGYDSYTVLCIIIFSFFKLSECIADVMHGMYQKVWRLDIAGKSFLMRGAALLAAFCCGELLFSNLLAAICLMAVSAHGIIYFYDFRQCKQYVNPDFEFTKKNVFRLFRFAAPLALYSLFLNIIATVPRVQIETQYGEEALGIFASIAIPTAIIQQTASFIFNPLMGIFAECRKNNDRKGLMRLLALCIGSILLISVGSVIVSELLGEWGLVLLFGESIREYTFLLTPVVYTAILTAVIWFLCGLMTVYEDYTALAVITATALGLCFIAAPNFVKKSGLMGAAAVWFISLGTAMLLLSARFIWLLRRENLNKERVKKIGDCCEK